MKKQKVRISAISILLGIVDVEYIACIFMFIFTMLQNIVTPMQTEKFYEVLE